MGTVHTTAEFANAFVLGLTKVHNDAADRMKLKKDYLVWLREEKAKHLFDTEWGVSDLAPMPEKEISGVIETDKIYQSDTKQFGLGFYAIGVVIQYEALRWDLHSIFPKLMKNLAKSAVDRQNLVAYSVLLNAFSSTDTTFLTHQGEALFTDTHTRLDGGTWSNAGTVGISYLGFQEARTELRKTVDERGIFMTGIDPKLVITSPDQEWIAETILQSTLRPSTADNDKNTLVGKGYQIKTSPYVTNATRWYLWDKNTVEISMRIGDEPKLTFDSDFRSMNRVGSAYCSFGLRVWDSKGAWASTGGG
jgi:hypothetical protein